MNERLGGNCMSMKIQTKVILVTFILIIITSSGLTFQNISEVKNNMYSEFEIKGMELAQNVTEKISMSEDFTRIIDEMMAQRILVACEGINEIPLSELSNEKITKFVNNGAIDEVYVIGTDRKIIFTNMADSIGWEYPKGHPMDSVFNGTSHSYMEAVRGDLISGKLNKYGGIALENGYYVQAGINATTIAEIKKKFSPSFLLMQSEGKGDVIKAYMVTKELTIEEQKKKDALENYDDTKRIYVINADVIEPEKRTEYTDNLGIQVFETGEAQKQNIKSEDGQEAYELLVPYMQNDKTEGVLVIDISLNRMNQLIESYLIKASLVTAVILVITLLVGLFVIKSVLKPIKVLKNQISFISEGDFTVKQDAKIMSSKDELGDIARAIEKMRNNLGELIFRIKNMSQDVEKNANQLSSIMNETSNAVEENAKAIEALAISATEQADESGMAANSAVELGKCIESGINSISDVNDQVQSIENKNKQSQKIILDLAEVVKENITRTDEVSVGIREVASVVKAMKEFMEKIQTISTQTNLLALNASIEAARAGESGKGFAVVADQIRKLAEETKTTTEQVEEIIDKINNKTSVASEQIHSIKGISVKQNDALENTLSVFEEIKNSIEKLGDSTIDVVKTINAVSDGKDIILNAVDKLAGLSEDLSATCEQISSATQEQSASIIEVNNLSEKNMNAAKILENELSKFKSE